MSFHSISEQLFDLREEFFIGLVWCSLFFIFLFLIGLIFCIFCNYFLCCILIFLNFLFGWILFDIEGLFFLFGFEVFSVLINLWGLFVRDIFWINLSNSFIFLFLIKFILIVLIIIVIVIIIVLILIVLSIWIELFGLNLFSRFNLSFGWCFLVLILVILRNSFCWDIFVAVLFYMRNVRLLLLGRTLFLFLHFSLCFLQFWFCPIKLLL